MQNITHFSQDFTCAVAPARMFKALILDSHNLIPKLVPQGIKSIEIVQGGGGPGTIKQTTFAEGSTKQIYPHCPCSMDPTIILHISLGTVLIYRSPATIHEAQD